jgi:MerR family transcriptional regulator, thiopeptide resistance regulator
MAHTVGEVARMASVTIRTLHHYDDIGLLTPSGRSDAGYRLYEHADLERLQELLFYRELGLGLDEIRRIVENEAYDRTEALREHRELLIERRDLISGLINAVETALDAQLRGIIMNPEDMLEVFGDFDPSQYEEEVKERWGESDAYKESARRTGRYTKSDWLQIKAEGGANIDRFGELLRAGADPTSDEAMEAAEEHRAQISRWFYDCGYDIHRGLAEMYVQDARFTKFYDDVEPGLARFVSQAIIANAQRNA